MDLRQLNALLAVADHGTFSAAADALHTVQSNVSAHIARLEKQVGSVLVDRVGGRLTEEGDAVVRRARRVVTEVDAIAADIAALRHEVVGEVRIGLIGTTARWLVPQILGIMSERFPHTHLRVTEATTTALEPQVSSGSLDLAVVLLPLNAPEIETEHLFQEDMLLVLPRDHELAELTEVTMRDLDGLPLILPPVGTNIRADLDNSAAELGATLVAKADVDGVHLTTSLVFDGYGSAILPATALPTYLKDEWRLVTVAGLPRRQVGLARPRRSYPTSPARALREVIREVSRSGAEMHPGLHPPAEKTGKQSK